jgi:EAL domain-containing protein (putative c-di-GMP-specific phosphodiesterase class I)
MEDAVETIRTLQQIRAMGIDISVDDFGTGYSSLNYLKRFPINKLKIDRSFMRGIAENVEDAAIVAAIINLGHSLHMDIVAEGVEQASQMQVLKAHDCDLLQGFYFSQPIPAEAFAERYLNAPEGGLSSRQ